MTYLIRQLHLQGNKCTQKLPVTCENLVSTCEQAMRVRGELEGD